MSTHLDIVGSVIIAGMIILNFTFFMGERQESQIESVNKVTTQTEMTDVTQTLRHDLRKIGYGCDSLPIIYASPTRLVFRADIDNDGRIDTVGYAFAPELDKSVTSTTTSTKISSTSETTTSTYTLETAKADISSFILHRRVNGQLYTGRDMNITGFFFKYYTTNAYGTLLETQIVSDVKAIGVVIRVQSVMQVDHEYKYTLTEFTVTPKNL
ncbi:MAG: hypothetical protein JXA28_01760 [Bacteroidetes bacterium]|nr:hypothetical protein [Bacteroidota bacterium]